MVGLTAAAASTAVGLYSASKSKNGSSSSQQQTSSGNPQWLNDASQDLYGQAQQIAARPYAPYTGATTAPLSSNQNSAIANAANNVGRFDNQYGAITDYLNKSGDSYNNTYTPTNVSTGTFNNADLSGYMNPYTQAVLAPQIADLREQQSIDKNTLDASAASTGNFGGSRQALAEDLQARRSDNNINNVTNTALSQAFNNAQTQYNNDQTRSLNADEFNQQQGANAFNTNYNVFSGNRDAQDRTAAGLNSLIGTQRGVTTAVDNDLINTGNIQQTQNQNNLNDLKSQYSDAQNYDMNNTNYLLGILRGNPTVGQVNTTPTPNNSVAQTLGTGLQLAGSANNLYNQFSNSYGSQALPTGSQYVTGAADPWSAGGSSTWVNPDTASSFSSFI